MMEASLGSREIGFEVFKAELQLVAIEPRGGPPPANRDKSHD
jgi:hypothetical protein